jgi:phosphopantetheinyl transferase
MRSTSSASKVTATAASRKSAPVADRRAADRPRFSSAWTKDFSAQPSLKRKAPTRFGGVDVWTARSRQLLRSASCCAVLSDNDRSELGAINDCGAREAATAARVLLRLALSRACKNQIDPRSWRFIRLDSGQLRIAEGLPQIQFSVSHGSSLAGVAVSSIFEVGLDLESVSFRVSTSVTETYLKSREYSRVCTLARPEGLRRTLRLWTLKEAFSKLLGVGLTNEFRNMEFQLRADAVLSTNQCFPLASTFFESLYIDTFDDLCLATVAVGAKSSHAAGQIQFFNLLETGRIQ